MQQQERHFLLVSATKTRGISFDLEGEGPRQKKTTGGKKNPKKIHSNEGTRNRFATDLFTWQTFGFLKTF
jgi:hypothetical protein